MGREAYLIKIQFKKLVGLSELDGFLKRYGTRFAAKDNAWINYEITSSKGIVEIQVRPKNEKVNSISLRFAVINPDSIIDKVVSILNGFSKTFAAVIEDYELKKTFNSLDGYEKAMKEKLHDLRASFTNGKNIVLKPIKAGKEACDYVKTNE